MVGSVLRASGAVVAASESAAKQFEKQHHVEGHTSRVWLRELDGS
jgi:hypothetical protein